ncbi:hypothetical protein FNV43_RR26733 [Rhamnella rubrinervis]|uniref:Uncharacterized protein n=1 Tax=Rhamnella rubrinervis TaxID=2594499 RepID=A0A8K0GP17_9ROSA|nr:hypothetical protein FNV43_RR26733 [Rhamnella rubrinervis]
MAIVGGTTTESVPMDFESTVIIVVFYDGTWFKGDDGRFQFKDYQSKVIEIPRNCTYAQLIDEVYKIVKVDREKYNVKMKYQYIEINSDQDVKIFIHVVKTIMCMTLYVEIISNVLKFIPDERNNDTYAKFIMEAERSYLNFSPRNWRKGKKKNMLMCPMLRKLNGKVKSLKVLFGILKISGKMYHIGKVKHNGKVKSQNMHTLGNICRKLKHT